MRRIELREVTAMAERRTNNTEAHAACLYAIEHLAEAVRVLEGAPVLGLQAVERAKANVERAGAALTRELSGMSKEE